MTEISNGMLLGEGPLPLMRAYQPTGSDEHRIETARWALETFAPETALYKQAQKVLANYLAGKPLPKSE